MEVLPEILGAAEFMEAVDLAGCIGDEQSNQLINLQLLLFLGLYAQHEFFPCEGVGLLEDSVLVEIDLALQCAQLVVSQFY
jgi:hypothetical protein